MSDDERPVWATFPEDMPVMAMQKLYATNVSQDGRVWLWVRYPHMTIALDFEPERADELAISFAQLAEQARAIRDEQRSGLQVVEKPIFGPDGRPL